MADNNKAVGPLAAAKLVTLIKALTAKKYDKTGGKIEGSAEITGGLKVGLSSEFSSSINAGSEISSDMLLMAPIVALHDSPTEEVISFSVSGDNAAKVTSPVSGGGTQYARLAVGTPASDNDAATKAYVDAKVDTTVYVDFWPTGSEDVYDKDFKAYVEEIAASQTFDAIFDSIKAGNKTIARFYSDESKSKFLASSVDATISGDKTLGTIHFQFLSAGTNNVAGFSFIGEAITLIKASSSTGIYLVAGETALPVPNSDGTDNGKVPTVNGRKWELKTPSAGGSPDAVLYTAQTLTDAQKKQARQNIEAANEFVINGTLTEGGTALLDTPYVEIQEAANSGKVPVVYLRSAATLMYFRLLELTPTSVTFTNSATDTNGLNHIYMLRVTANEPPSFAGSAPLLTLNSDGTMPQTSMAADPAGDMQIATKKYVDDSVTGACGGSTATVDTVMSDTSANAVQNKVIKKYVDDKVAAAGSNITVDATLSSTSTNPVQNKAVKAAIDAKADKTALDAKADKTALNAKMDKSGGTFTGNVSGKYFCGTWLQSTAASDLGRTPGKIAVLDDSGWVYYRTPSELFADLGITNAIKSYVDTAIVVAINSSY